MRLKYSNKYNKKTDVLFIDSSKAKAPDVLMSVTAYLTVFPVVFSMLFILSYFVKKPIVIQKGEWL
jgi:predicted O-methyltransferase YrrM